MGRDMLTSDDLAEYLHIHKNQIYRLIKEKRLPATRITGKWLFPKQLVDQWIQDSARKMVGLTPVETSNRVVIAGSNDIALESLTKYVHSWNRNFTVSLSNLGSAAGLRLWEKGPATSPRFTCSTSGAANTTPLLSRRDCRVPDSES